LIRAPLSPSGAAYSMPDQRMGLGQSRPIRIRQPEPFTAS
jgi:hypothetical protein